ncbi:DHH family phosphoesterase [Salinibaculum rarum]|uniref:DHH family phosphoesterase n=1 Tax=Salinibaculum rarum TaxID=3058903 RepID=UPI00265FB904|nr:bifunctional oligoribonuclease/PAP phosphatase NrnA [Salinibaculum sp. KK48]
MLSAEAGSVALQVEDVSAFVTENPLLAVGALVGVVFLVGLVALALRRKQQTGGTGFSRLLARYDEVSVLMHPNPDPDAMSAALGVQTIANSVDTDTEIQYPGQIRHQENRAFETVLDLEFDHIDSDADLGDRPVVLVDHNEPRGFPGSETVDPVAVIDHHPGGGKGREFTDVRTENGACATILAEYFEEMGWEPADPDDDDSDEEEATLPSRVATGLIYGIQSDTKSLTKGCSDAEFEAAAFLYPGVDEDSLDRIANPEVDAEVLDIKATAIRNRVIEQAFAVSDVGAVSNVDAIPQAADELLRLEGVTAVVVLGEKDGTIHLSGRSRDDRVHMGKALRAVVEDVPMAGAGGHARMGGGQLSLDHMEGLGPSNGMTRDQLKDRLFASLSGDL